MIALVMALATLQDAPLKPLGDVAEHLDAGMTEFLKGAAAGDAWKPWPVRSDGAALREALRQAGVVKATHLAMEFELLFRKKGAAVLYVRAYVLVRGGAIAIVNLESRDKDIRVADGRPIDAHKDHAAPFAEAARAFLAVLRAKDVSKLRFADADALAALPESVRKPELERAERGKAAAARIAEAVAACDADEVHLRIDDHAYLALDGAGAAVGVVRCHFEWDGDRVVYNPGSFRGFPK